MSKINLKYLTKKEEDYYFKINNSADFLKTQDYEEGSSAYYPFFKSKIWFYLSIFFILNKVIYICSFLKLIDSILFLKTILSLIDIYSINDKEFVLNDSIYNSLIVSKIFKCEIIFIQILLKLKSTNCTLIPHANVKPAIIKKKPKQKGNKSCGDGGGISEAKTKVSYL